MNKSNIVILSLCTLSFLHNICAMESTEPATVKALQKENSFLQAQLDSCEQELAEKTVALSFAQAALESEKECGAKEHEELKQLRSLVAQLQAQSTPAAAPSRPEVAPGGTGAESKSELPDGEILRQLEQAREQLAIETSLKERLNALLENLEEKLHEHERVIFEHELMAQEEITALRINAKNMARSLRALQQQAFLRAAAQNPLLAVAFGSLHGKRA